MIEINHLHVTIDDKEILQGVNLCVQAGEIHAIMGPNGAGKSTLAKVLAGHPSYKTSGSVFFKGKDLLSLTPEERSHEGVFMSFQYPVEIPGVSNKQFLHAACNAKRKSSIPEKEFESLVQEKMSLLKISPEFLDRNVNEGFSGGEKKRNEILQMALLNPDLAVLDETDSGLDIDALRIVAEGINALITKDNALIIITHYQRLLEYVRPHFVHVMMNGKIARSGGYDLAIELEERGYDWVESNLVAGIA